MGNLDAIKGREYDAVVIGSGFGAAIAAEYLSRPERKLKVLIIERGTWWGNPEGPGLAPQKPAAPQPLGVEQRQWWPRPNDSRGLVYVLRSVYKEVDPFWDVVNPFIRDNDLAMKRNRRGLYRLTRFSDAHGNVDVVSTSAVGGGSLVYSGVNLIPPRPVLERIGLGHLTSADFQVAGKWMGDVRGRISKVNTKIPVPHRAGTDKQLSVIPESGDAAPASPSWEMGDPVIPAHEEDYLYLDRARVLKRAKARVERAGGFTVGERTATTTPFKPLPLSIVEYDPAADASADPYEGKSSKTHAFCTRDGRCLNGCLPSARHTLYKALEDTKRYQVLPQTKVSHVSRDGQRYKVHFESFLEDRDGDTAHVFAKRVVFGAGCLGTTEIMLRSKRAFETSGGREGLPLSPAVGSRFSTNADFFGFALGVGDPKGSDTTVPDQDRIGKANPTAGPINSSGFHVVFGSGTPERVDIHVEDAGVPTMFARFLHEVLPAFEGDFKALARIAQAFVRAAMGKEPFDSFAQPDTTARDQEAYQTEHQLLSDLFFFNAMGSGADEPFGTFYLDDRDTMQLRYAKERPLAGWAVFRHVEAVLKRLADAMLADPKAGRFVVSPFWRQEQRVTVVHPLGGCPVVRSGPTGVVDAKGRVFDGEGASATDVLPNLYVVDAAALPGALAVNPTFTIATHAHYVMRHLTS